MDMCICSTGGHLEVLKWLRDPNLPDGGSKDISREMSSGLFIDFLEKSALGMKVCANAAQKGHLELLKWLRD